VLAELDRQQPPAPGGNPFARVRLAATLAGTLAAATGSTHAAPGRPRRNPYRRWCTARPRDPRVLAARLGITLHPHT
jgi:hypothetical protein